MQIFFYSEAYFKFEITMQSMCWAESFICDSQFEYYRWSRHQIICYRQNYGFVDPSSFWLWWMRLVVFWAGRVGLNIFLARAFLASIKTAHPFVYLDGFIQTLFGVQLQVLSLSISFVRFNISYFANFMPCSLCSSMWSIGYDENSKDILRIRQLVRIASYIFIPRQ